MWSGKTATISGAVSDAAGGGKLDVTGNLAFAGTLEVAAANLGSSMMNVVGSLDLSGATVTLADDIDETDLEAYAKTDVALVSASSITGVPELDAPALGGRWKLRARNGNLNFAKIRRLCVVVR